MISTSPTPPPRAAGLPGDKHHLPGSMSNHAQDMEPVPAAGVNMADAVKAPHPMIAALSNLMLREFN